jgi:putative zinc finger/helix-turn-helix YgiT family protein
MGNQEPIIGFPDRKETQCPACGKESLGTRVEETSFVYGTGAAAVDLTCSVPVHKCADCAFEFTDDKAEDARDLAVRRYLKVMTPEQIRAIRDSYRISRREFGAVTRIGEASLARWESGEIIQNAGYDQFLYLLKFPENLQRLKERKNEAEEASQGAKPISSLQVRFSSIRDFAQVLPMANAFQLRKAS